MVSGVCALQGHTITSIGLALRIDCLFVSGSVWCACGNYFPSQLNPMADFSIATKDPLYNGRTIFDDVHAGSASSALATVLMDQWAWGETAGPQAHHMAQATVTHGSQTP